MFSWLRRTKNNAPDFGDIDSQQKVIEHYEKGHLAKMYLFPLEFGGEYMVANIVYVPQFVVDLKKRFDSMIPDLISKGLVSNYSATPKYKGNSFIPSEIKLKVNGKSNFEETINIW